MRARRLALAVLASLCVLAGGSLFASAPALALPYHKYETQIAGSGPMTVDGGDLLVNEGSRLAEYDASSDALVAQLGASAVGLGGFTLGIAEGHATGEGEVYVGASGEGVSVLGVGGCGTVACATLQREWKGADTPNGSFIYNKSSEQVGLMEGIAVDNSTSAADWAKGDVFVATTSDYTGANQNVDVVDVFKPEADGKEKYVAQLTNESIQGEAFEPYAKGGSGAVAVSAVNGDVMVVNSQSVVDVFEPKGVGEYALVRELTGPYENAPFGSISGVAVAGVSGVGAGDVFVSASGGVYEFSPSGEFLDRIAGTPSESFASPGSVAVDPGPGRLFVGDAGAIDVFSGALVVPDTVMEGIANAKYESGPQTWALDLRGSVNPDGAGPATCRFMWGRTPALGSEARCEGPGESVGNPVPNGGSPVAVHAGVTDLAPDTTYYYRLQAFNANGPNEGEEAEDQQFTTGGPGVHGESASSVTSSSVTLNAEIDPDNAPTSYYFQYGTSTAYGESVPLAPGVAFGSGKGDVGVSVHLQGLAAGMVYHYRVVAVGESGGEVVTVAGSDKTFTTQAVGSLFTLPDGRAWELVTPPDKQGAGIVTIGGDEYGDDIQAAESGNGITYEATAPIVADPAGSRSLESTQAISLRSAAGVWSTQDIATPHNEGAPALPIGETSEYRLFSDDLSLGFVQPVGDTPLGSLPAGSEKTVYLREADGEYEALVTSGNVQPGCKFGGLSETYGGVKFVDATPDMSHVLVNGPGCLYPGGAEGLYEWSGGKLNPVDVLPDGEIVGGGLAGVRRGIANDGSRVVWESGGVLYLRDMASGETVHVAEEASFQIGDGDESRLFFTSGGSLEVFEVTSGSGQPLAGVTTKLAEGGVEGEVLGAGEDGSYVYFVDSGVLGDGAEHGAENGGHNLYVEHYDETAKTWESPSFIALLSSEDSPTWAPQNGDLSKMTSRVSPNGRYLAFMSDRSLTGYENRDANNDVPDEEVFLYDADTDRLVCASCDPTRARPVGLFVGEHAEESALVDGIKTWGNRWLAANIPAWTPSSLSLPAAYQSRYLSDSGRLFFNSSDALVPADVNGKEDVYEYEPAGVGSCQAPAYGQSASDVFVEGAGGCVGLISAGSSSEESAFLDASESGGDVFFLTSSRLSPQDVDTSYDIYDAHECTAAVPCAPPPVAAPPACTTADSCKPAPSLQPAIFGAPASETFVGSGNVVVSGSTPVVTGRSLTRAQKLAKALKACTSRPKRRRAACRRLARKRYGASSARVETSLSVKAER
jgi:hypothetical protein